MSSRALGQTATVGPPPSPAALDRARALFAALGDPQDRFPAVHVAGTAGKGSVSAFVASLLRAHGFRVGAHLSPHACCLLERFQLGGSPAPAELVDAELRRIRPAVAAVELTGHGRPSFFEVTNAIAFSLFAGRVDHGVIETGVGGLVDSTNTISRADKVSVITPIGLDHQDLLGATVAEIARQKAGILTSGGRAVAARPCSTEVAEVLVAEAARRGCDLRFVDLGPPGGAGPDRAGRHRPPPLRPPVPPPRADRAAPGRQRPSRAERPGGDRCPGRVGARYGCRPAGVVERRPAGSECRVIGGRMTVLDGAHNPMKLAALVATLQEVHPALEVIAPTAALVVATQFATEDGDHAAGTSVPAAQIAMAARNRGLEAVVEEEEPACAVTRAAQHADVDLPVVVSGSFHLLPAVRPGTTAA